MTRRERVIGTIAAVINAFIFGSIAAWLGAPPWAAYGVAITAYLVLVTR